MSEYTKEFKKSITDEELAELPLSFFEGKIHMIEKVEQVTDAVNYLKKQPILGFDTETRPTFKKGQNHQVALLQLSTADQSFLFRINMIGSNSRTHQKFLAITIHPEDRRSYPRRHQNICSAVANHFKPGGFVELAGVG